MKLWCAEPYLFLQVQRCYLSQFWNSARLSYSPVFNKVLAVCIKQKRSRAGTIHNTNKTRKPNYNLCSLVVWLIKINFNYGLNCVSSSGARYVIMCTLYCSWQTDKLRSNFALPHTCLQWNWIKKYIYITCVYTYVHVVCARARGVFYKIIMYKIKK